MTSHWFDLGDVAVVPIVETPRLLIAPEEFFPDVSVDPGQWCFQEPWFDAAAGRLIYTIQSFLVVTPAATVLVDACVGGGKRRTRPEFADLDAGWLAALRATGTSPLDVDTVVLTHLHVDHVGWCTQEHDGEWRPVFRNARHAVTGAELDHWTGPAGAAAMQRTGDYVADSVEPLRAHGLLDVVRPDTVVAPGVRLEPASGHTPGNVVVRVTGSGGELVLAGDVLHHPVQLRHPQVSTRYCVDPAAAAGTRARLLADLAASGTPLVPAHFPAPTAGRVDPTPVGYTFRAAADLLRTTSYPLRS